MVLAPNDILGTKPALSRLNNHALVGPADIEQKIFEALSAEPLTVDELALFTGQNVIETGKTLTIMALKGVVAETNGKYFLEN